MFAFYTEAYPWDVVSAAGRARLERLRGEVGITGVSLWASIPRVVILHRFDGAVGMTRSAGGLLYGPRGGAFSSLPCEPVVADVLAERSDAMPRAIEVCDQLGLNVRLVASVLRGGRLAGRFGEFAAVNAFGIKSGDCLCASHDEVRGYVRGLATSLHDLGPGAGLVVADMTFDCRDVFCREWDDVAPLEASERSLLASCFCGACASVARSAGVDADEARSALRRVVERALDGQGPAGWDLEFDERVARILRAYRATQCGSVRRLFEILRDAWGGEELVYIDEGAGAGGAPGGTVLQVSVGFFPSLAGVADAGRRPVEIAFPAGLAVSTTGADLTSFLKAAVDAGVRGVTMRHLSIVPDAAVQPLKQAVRFARRTVAT